MEIGQNPIDQGYAQRPLNSIEQRPSPQQNAPENSQETQNQSVRQSESPATTGAVGRNIDTYA
ncbi:hypothetical protein [Alteromonas gilva]|uniref:Uncharacterized protein n=1 Tax=Alteromonas gilva TaxID=2987522 RepID=A0ABT5L3Y8_9ALTE|nr:hypothetical protein [Alteromonas gilva]MDC8831753.1 hypothetical protein [Alteromonas gilva]